MQTIWTTTLNLSNTSNIAETEHYRVAVGPATHVRENMARADVYKVINRHNAVVEYETTYAQQALQMARSLTEELNSYLDPLLDTDEAGIIVKQ